MHEMLHWAAGGRLPIVMGNINRSMAPGWSIWADQNDSLSQRDTGWMQFYCSSNQEVLDMTILAFKVSEAIGIPSMVILDAFALSHTYEVVEIPEQDRVDAFLPSYKPYARLTPDKPCAFDGLTGPEHYFELRYKLQKDMEKVPALVEATGLEFEKAFGRRLTAVEDYRCDDAEIILVTSGTAGYTARVAVDEMRKEGIKVGNLRIKMFRPFPFADVRRILARAAKIAVVDRNISYGYHGIFAQEVKAALSGSGVTAPVFGFIAGLGGRDITPGSFREVVDIAGRQNTPAEEINWIGVKK
jgi:pyruvate/2-oxoacid:ferredoxin oxidoreductase alpha subunit